ncbi:MAG: hypothetical protein ACFE0I_03360 [Elainellaceae cyanobacterium]
MERRCQLGQDIHQQSINLHKWDALHPLNRDVNEDARHNLAIADLQPLL